MNAQVEAMAPVTSVAITAAGGGFALDAGLQSTAVHKLHFTEGMFVVSFNFRKDLRA